MVTVAKFILNLRMRKLFLNRFFCTGMRYRSSSKTLDNASYQFNFDSNEEIVENYLGNVMLIGINLPERKNLLTETAVEKLSGALNNFYVDKNIGVAVLHGLGGNFCSGLDPSENALNKGRQVIEKLCNRKKPIIGSLNGHTIDFGFQLAIMCDMRVMDENSVIGFGRKNQRTSIVPAVCKGLMEITSLPIALEMILTNCTFSARRAAEVGLSNRTVDYGTALGQAINWGQSIMLSPVETVIEDRAQLYFLSSKKLV